jgi:uncharacterized membrane protein
LNEPAEYDYARLIFNGALLASLGVVGFYLIGKFRHGFRQSEQGSSHLLDNFRELHTRGQLSDEEYRNIKSKLAAQLRDEMRESEQAE